MINNLYKERLKRQSSACLILFIGLLTGLGSQAQNKISGYISDERKAAIEYVGLRLIRLPDSVLIGTAMSDSAGHYDFANIQSGKYALILRRIGYKEKSVLLDAALLNTGILNLTLSANANELKEVSIAARQRVIIRKADRMVFNVSNSVLAPGKTAYEMLSYAPGVIAGSDGDIKIGSISGTRLMVNGRLLKLTGEDLQNYLSSIMADDIISIEVIPHPPASFDAGTGGIIKINIRKIKQKGFEGLLSTNGSQGRKARVNGLGSASLRLDKVLLSASYNRQYVENFSDKEMFRQQMPNASSYSSSSGSTDRRNTSNYRFGFEYDFRNNHTLILDASGSSQKKDVKQMNMYSRIFNNGKIDSLIRSDNIPDVSNNNNNSYSLSYQWDIDTSGSKLEILSDYIYFKNDRDTYYNNRYYNSSEEFIKAVNRYSELSGKMKIYTAQAAFTKYLRKDLNYNAGFKFSDVRNNNDNNYLLINDSAGTWIEDNGLSNSLNYSENIYAGYFNLSGSINNFDYVLGLRAEETKTSTGSRQHNEKYSNRYFNLFPSAFFSYKLSDIRNISISYTRGIIRPPYQALNPYTILINENTVSEGNPYLKPVTSHNFSTAFALNDELSFSLNYTVQKNLFGDIETGTANQTVITTANIARSKDLTLDVFWARDIRPWWSVTNNISGTRNTFQDNNYDQKGNFLYATTNNTFNLSKIFALQFNGRLFTKGVDRYYRSLMNTWIFDVGGNVKLMNKKLILSFGVNDIFYRDGNRQMVMINNGLYTFTQAKWDTRRAYAGLKWSIKKSQVKARGKKKSNEDELSRTP